MPETKMSEPAQWTDEGLHFVAKVGRRCRLRTHFNGTHWTCAVRGHFSSSGDTREQAIRNACA